MKFLDEIPKNGDAIYWGTYNISFASGKKANASKSTIKAIKKVCGPNSLRIICESPENQIPPFNKRSLLTKDAFELLNSNDIDVKYFSNLSDENGTEIDRTHHAKYLIFKNKALIGSFNFSHQSLHHNIESLVWIEGDEIQSMYDEISANWEDGVFDEVDPDKLEKQHSPEKESQLITPVLVDVKKLYNEISKKLYAYQKEIFNELINRNYQIDVLCLPTGLGKTFIAIAWLLKQGENKGNQAKMLIITPNRLIKETIKNICINELKMPDLIDAIYIKTAREFADDDYEFNELCAAVLDEVHNWNPGDESSDYNIARNKLKSKKIKILGISATPSRHPNYDQEDFYREFCESENSILTKYTVMHAINQKWLIQPEWKAVSQSCDHLKNYTPIKGKYSERMLMREWWNALAEDEDLIDTIVNEIKSNKLKKGLIYIPPVGEDLKNIVEDIDYKLSNYAEVLDIQSRNCSSPESVIKKFRDSKKPVFLISINRASEGISIPEIDSLIMLRMPLSDNLAIQLIGRGLRLHPNKKRLFVLDAVGYEKRLEMIPAWNGSALLERQTAGAGAGTKKGIDYRIDVFIKIVIECMYDDTDYSYDFFLRHHIDDLLESKNFDSLIRDGFSGKLKRDFGDCIKIRVYGTNAERDKRILSNLPKNTESSEILKDFIELNKEDFVYRYISGFEEEQLLVFAKENIGKLSLENLVNNFLEKASNEMREGLFNVVFDYDEQYVKRIKKNTEKCRSVLIDYLEKAARFSALK
jgi:superfamily II DNA or RNA helicase